MTYQEFCSKYELSLTLHPYNFIGIKDGLACYSYGSHSEVVLYLNADRFNYVDTPVLHSPYDSQFHHIFSPYYFRSTISYDMVGQPLKFIPFFRTLVGKYFLRFTAVSNNSSAHFGSVVTVNDPSPLPNSDFPPFVFDTFDDALKFCGDYTVSFPMWDIQIVHLTGMSDSVYSVNSFIFCDLYGESFFYYGLSKVDCCEPDFSRIVQILGGTPSSDQLLNIKTIASLLGCDTSDNGLSGCELGLLYVKRIVTILGGSFGSDLATTLKEVCRILGVDNSENGLSGCELAKDYVNRISIMLGG